MIANLLSAARLAAALPFAVALFYSIERADTGQAPSTATWVAALLYVSAVLSDLLDGVVARAARTESEFGRLLDHLADFVFVASGLTAAAWGGALPWALPPLVEPGLRGNWLGRANGVLYFFPLGGVLLAQLGMRPLANAAHYLAWLLVFTTLASVTQRFSRALAARRQTAPSEPAAETTGQSRR